jgi:diguanylate cyclase (GGDEF)-like protein
VWGTLKRDPVFRAALLVWALAALPYLVPLLSPAALENYGLIYSNWPLLLVGIAACRFGLEKLPDRMERIFWALWATALGLWLGQSFLAAVPALWSDPWARLGQDFFYVAFYFCLLVSLRLEPHLGPERPGWTRPRLLAAAGTAVFALGLLVYFAGVPLIYEPRLDSSDVPSLVMYLVFDCLLVVRLTGLRLAAGTPRWRALYGLLLVTAGLWLVTDALELLMHVEIVKWVPAGTPLDLVWWLPLVTLVIAARLREHPFATPREALTATPGSQLQERWGDPLVAYTAALPLIHLALYGFGALSPETRSQRDLLTLALLVILAALAIAYQKALISENLRFDEVRNRAAQAEHKAYHDALTGLPNRYLLLDRLQLALPRARRTKNKVAVFFLDLDRFKPINDTLGHSAGDELLRQVAARLALLVRQGDTLARFGGDEFTVLVEGIRQPEDALKVAQKLRDVLREPFQIAGRELPVTASIGISLYPDDGSDAEALVQRSDMAMYRAKEHGRDGYELFRADISARSEERLRLEKGLRSALVLEQFAVQYQPIYSLTGGRLRGCEALLRWRHPEQGLLLPGAFIDLAELTGIIAEVGYWVLGNACQEAQRWRSQSGTTLTVAVNLSPRQLLDPALPRHVEELLAQSGLAPGRLELEISETLAMQNAEATRAVLVELKQLGVRVAIDDFGTGYSSVGYLKRFPIDTLKIDHSLVRGIHADSGEATVTATVIAMAQALGLEVVAEGVERADQARVLREQGCTWAQGYLMGPPVWPEELGSVLQRD